MEDGSWYTIEGYQAMAKEFQRNWYTTHYGDRIPTFEELEEEYWNILKNVTGEDVQVDYFVC